MRRCVPAFLLILAASAAGQSSCATANGLYLATSGGRLGDPWFVGVNGNPGVSGYLGADLASGPTSTPIGPVCLGLTPNLQLVPFSLGGSGTFSLGGTLPADPALTGLTAFLQAAAADPGQPGGYAVSNGAGITLRPPRVFFLHPGTPSLPNLPGSFCVYDCLTDTVTGPSVSPPGYVVHSALIPSLGWVAFLLSNGNIACYDSITGAQALYLPTTPFAAQLAVEGTTLYALCPGSLFGPTILGSVRSFSLPSGTPGVTCTLPPGTSNQFMVLPGQGIAYVLMSALSAPYYTIQPVDLVNGAPLPPVATGASFGQQFNVWLQVGGVLHCLTAGVPNGLGLPPSPGSLISIDTLTHTTLHPAPVPLPTGVTAPLWYGPGTSGNALFAYTGSHLLQIDPATLAVTATIPVPTPLWQMTLSPGGTEWTMLVGGTPLTLQRMTPPSFSVTTFASLPPWVSNLARLAVIPSPTVRRAFVMCNGTVLPFDTDPATAPTQQVALPFTPTSMIVD